MRIALAQINPTIGDIDGNTALVLGAIAQSRDAGANCILLPELALIGYPPRDLLLRDGITERCGEAIARIAAETANITAIVGHPRRAEGGTKHLHNSATVLHDGVIAAVYDKQLLPGYDVFDEDRWFEPGANEVIVDIADHRCGILICEDIWRARDATGGEGVIPTIHTDPVARLAERGCEVLLVPSASPFVRAKDDRHLHMLRDMARTFKLTIALTNEAGGNDDVIFDGRSVVVSPAGDVLGRGASFASDLVIVDTETAKPLDIVPDDPTAETFDALILGVRDYVRKTGHSHVTIGLSGGIDSALTAVIAAIALGPDRITGIMMPSRYSSNASRDDAKTLAKNLGVRDLREISIAAAHEALTKTLAEPVDEPPGSITDQNVQARLRGIILMAMANATGSLVLATGNKSELATGYCTLYGDMAGAICPLGDVLKTDVYALARWANEHHRKYGFDKPPIPESSITKVPTAELYPDQTDQDVLPPYDELDQIIRRYIEDEESADRIVAETDLDADLVYGVARQIDRAEYKRMQAPIVLKVSPRAFGPGRPMPAAMRYEPRSRAD